MTKEFSICLSEDKTYFPGETIKGYVQLHLTKPADIQLILLNLKGIVEAHGEKIVLIDKIEKLALPKEGQKYTVFNPGELHKFDFQFEIPNNDKSLPSTTHIPKVVNVSYFLTATPKKPSFNFSHTLPVITKEVKLLDLINIDSEHYRRGINMNRDLGFTNGCKPTQWNLTASRSAFVRGEKIQLECELNNFPPIKKSEAIKISFIRCVDKCNSKKKIEKKILMHKSIDVHITEMSSTQSVSIAFNIPCETPVSVFPISGRIMSISYIIQAELNMKGAKSAIKLKDHYILEANIVIGTHPPLTETATTITPALGRRESTLTSTSYYTTLSTASLNACASGTDSLKNTSIASLPLQQRPPVKSFHAALGDLEVKPLAKLDENSGTIYDTNTLRRSYLNRSSTPSTPLSGSYFDQRTAPRSPTSPVMMRHHPQLSPPINRSITPLPSITANSGYNTISYINRPNRSGPILLEQTLPSASKITVSSPHEIGPNDIINRGTSRDSKTIVNYDNDKTTYENNDSEKSERFISPLSRVPSLTRQSTVSTSSSSGLIGLIDEQIEHFNYTSVPSSTNK